MESHWSLRRYYLHLNRKWFNGELPLDVIVTWEPCDNAWGELFTLGSGRLHITLDTGLRGMQEFMLITLLHEMAHIALGGPNYGHKHGRRWRAEMRRLAAAGAFDELW